MARLTRARPRGTAVALPSVTSPFRSRRQASRRTFSLRPTSQRCFPLPGFVVEIGYQSRRSSSDGLPCQSPTDDDRQFSSQDRTCGSGHRPPAPTVPQSDPDRQGNHAHSQLGVDSARLRIEVVRPRSFSTHTSPHPIRRTPAFGTRGGASTGVDVARLERDSAQLRVPTRTVARGRPTASTRGLVCFNCVRGKLVSSPTHANKAASPAEGQP